MEPYNWKLKFRLQCVTSTRMCFLYSVMNLLSTFIACHQCWRTFISKFGECVHKAPSNFTQMMIIQFHPILKSCTQRDIYIYMHAYIYIYIYIHIYYVLKQKRWHILSASLPNWLCYTVSPSPWNHVYKHTYIYIYIHIHLFIYVYVCKYMHIYIKYVLKPAMLAYSICIPPQLIVLYSFTFTLKPCI